MFIICFITNVFKYKDMGLYEFISALLPLLTANSLGVLLVTKPVLRRMGLNTQVTRPPGSLFWRHTQGVFDLRGLLLFLVNSTSQPFSEEIVYRLFIFAILERFSTSLRDQMFDGISSVLFCLSHVYLGWITQSKRSLLCNLVCWLLSGIGFAWIFKVGYMLRGDTGDGVGLSAFCHLITNLGVRAILEFGRMPQIRDVY